MLRRLALVVGLSAATAAPLQGQVQVGLSPFIGAYLPMSNLFDSIRLGGEGGPVVLNLGQQPSAMLGGRITVRVMSQLAIEAEAGYALSSLDVPRSADPVDGSSEVILGSLNVMWIFFQAPFSPMSLHLTGGIGVTARNGDFWRNIKETTDLGGVLGFGIRYGLTPLIFLRFDFRDYIYSFAPTAGNFTFESKLQNDLVASVALEFALKPAN